MFAAALTIAFVSVSTVLLLLVHTVTPLIAFLVFATAPTIAFVSVSTVLRLALLEDTPTVLVAFEAACLASSIAAVAISAGTIGSVSTVVESSPAVTVRRTAVALLATATIASFPAPTKVLSTSSSNTCKDAVLHLALSLATLLGESILVTICSFWGAFFINLGTAKVVADLVAFQTATTLLLGLSWASTYLVSLLAIPMLGGGYAREAEEKESDNDLSCFVEQHGSRLFWFGSS